MNCHACGFENSDGSKFCSECGKALSQSGRCARCGSASLPGDIRFEPPREMALKGLSGTNAVSAIAWDVSQAASERG